MLDIRYVRENAQEVAENCRRRRVDADVPALVAGYEQRIALQQELDQVRKRQNEVSKATGKAKDPEIREALVAEGRELRKKEEELRERHDRAKGEFDSAMARLPNRTHPAAPVGQTDQDNREVRRWGEPRRFDFAPLDHVELGKKLDLLDLEAGGKVAGSNFYYLKNEAVFLELALLRFALGRLAGLGFAPHLTPDLARPQILEGIGFQPRGPETQVYSVEGHDLCLIGTAEITLGGLYAGHVFEAKELPLKLAGLSHCFRTEAGAAGRESKGLYRVHQFTKVEMFAYVRAQDSDATLDELVGIEESIFRDLEVPYRVVDTCTGDLGGPAYRKYDIEAWMPGRGSGGDWGEVTSSSNCTDFQARRLNVRYRPAEGAKPEFVHMLNGTAVAVSRALVALLENHQEADGSVRVPSALVPYAGFERIDARLDPRARALSRTKGLSANT